MLPNLRLLSISFIVLCGFLSSAVYAAETRTADRRDVLRFGIMSLAPYGYKDGRDEWVGNLFEIANAIIKEGNFNGYSAVVPLKRLFQKDHLDCTITAAVPHMEKTYARVVGLDQKLEFGVLPLANTQLNSYADLTGISIAVPLGANVGLPFDDDETLNKVRVQDYSAGMLMLERGRVDGAAGVISSLRFSARIAGVDEVFGKPLLFKTLPLNIYCEHDSITRPYWDKIRAAVQTLIEKGEIERIMQKYQ